MAGPELQVPGGAIAKGSDNVRAHGRKFRWNFKGRRFALRRDFRHL
jgi:hypothetical protein